MDREQAEAERLRIDRWLWCARFFKSRSAAAEAVRAGHVRLNGERVKPAHAVKIGDALRIEAMHGEGRELAVVAIPSRRGPASEAARSYSESPESIERRRRAAEDRALRKITPPTYGKPDKHTRRLVRSARRRGALNEP
jgi:ribosome-associated heat shock protein Hsp15